MTLFDLPLFFDKEAEFSVTEGHLPHWDQIGTVCFITFRTWDSMPQSVVEEFIRERNVWLHEHKIDPNRPNWDHALTRLPPTEQAAFRHLRSARWERSLDNCSGSCPLRVPSLSKVVADSLLHFDGTRYVIFDFVVMPNHVHVLASFQERGALLKQCESWKHYTATRLNKLLGRKGRFWEEESFDHLVRSEAQFERLREYIAENPAKARLRFGEFVHYSRDLPMSPSRTCSQPGTQSAWSKRGECSEQQN